MKAKEEFIITLSIPSLEKNKKTLTENYKYPSCYFV